MTSGLAAWGTLLNWDTEDVVELTSISGPTETLDTIDLTSHDSTLAFREFVAGLHDGGEISIEGNFIPTNGGVQHHMHEDFQSGTAKDFIIKFPAWVDTSHEYPEITGSGIITAFSPDFPFDGKISISATIKVTGVPTLTLA